MHRYTNKCQDSAADSVWDVCVRVRACVCACVWQHVNRTSGVCQNVINDQIFSLEPHLTSFACYFLVWLLSSLLPFCNNGNWSGALTNAAKICGTWPTDTCPSWMGNLYIKKKIISSSYRGADKFLAPPTSRCILFDGENISFDASLVICINGTNIPPIIIINRIYEHQNFLSL
jgi:hypothetical protein